MLEAEKGGREYIYIYIYIKNNMLLLGFPGTSDGKESVLLL